MADAITIQELIDARTDAKTLEEAVNGDAVTTVLSRLGETYPTLSNALNQIDSKLDSADTQIKQGITNLFENGGLPATPFATKALMTASALVDGDYAMVTDDSVADDNGLYVKTAGAWVKSDYDPLMQAKADATTKADAAKAAAISEFKANDGAVKYGQDYFTGLGGYTSTGVLGAAGYEARRHTPRVPVIKGEKVIVKTDFTSSGTLRIVFFNSMGDVSKVVRSTAVEPAYTPHEAIADVDGYVSTHCVSASSTGCSITVGVGSDLFVKTKDAVSQSDVDKKANTVKIIDYAQYLEKGYVTTAGVEVESLEYARTPVYKLDAGTVLTFSQTSGYQWGYNDSDTDVVTHDSSKWYASNTTKTVTAEKPYVRFFVRHPFEPADLPSIDIVKSAVSVTTATSVAYVKDVKDIVENSVAKTTSVSSNINSMFRTPSLASGGVVTIIDDDGRDAVYSGLYPFLKTNGVPFGAAIVPYRMGKTMLGSNFMTIEELKELAEDIEYFETMSHTWSHQNQTNTALTLAEKENEIIKAKQWFSSEGFVNVDGFIYPYGADDVESRLRVQKYYNQAYDYDSGSGVSTFDTINNYLIKRTSWNLTSQGLEYHKARLDEVVANDGWLVICTHVDNTAYWDENTYAQLQEFIDYAKSKGVKFMLPRDGFQTFGNIVENDSGFKIQANGKMVGAT